jgi:hypothetical protein
MDSLEIWKRITGFSAYWISNKGDVYSTKSKKMLKGHIRGDGLLTVHIADDKGKWRTCQVHRLMALEFIDSSKTEYTVSFRDGDCKNLSVDNIYFTNNLIEDVMERIIFMSSSITI